MHMVFWLYPLNQGVQNINNKLRKSLAVLFYYATRSRFTNRYIRCTLVYGENDYVVLKFAESAYIPMYLIISVMFKWWDGRYRNEMIYTEMSIPVFVLLKQARTWFDIWPFFIWYPAVLILNTSCYKKKAYRFTQPCEWEINKLVFRCHLFTILYKKTTKYNRLTNIISASILLMFGKPSIARSDATTCGVWSFTARFVYRIYFFEISFIASAKILL